MDHQFSSFALQWRWSNKNDGLRYQLTSIISATRQATHGEKRSSTACLERVCVVEQVLKLKGGGGRIKATDYDIGQQQLFMPRGKQTW